jgi:hypothetical protein
MFWSKKYESKLVDSNILYAASSRAVQGSATQRGLFNAAVRKFLVAGAIEYTAQQGLHTDAVESVVSTSGSQAGSESASKYDA